MEKPDFKSIISLNDARRASADGLLVRTFLFPIEFGGEDVPQNVIYIPVTASDARSKVIKYLINFVQAQGVIQLHAVPEYRGDSFIPSRIIYQAFPSSTHFAPIVRTVEIW